MSNSLMTNCKMNWEMENHSFVFHTGGCRMEALDSLGDLIGSLKELYKHIGDEYDTWEKQNKKSKPVIIVTG